MRCSSLALAALIAAAPLLAHAADPAPVVAAEQAFAARAAEVGVVPSFLEFMADDAIVFAPGPVSARELYGKKTPAKTPKEGGTLLAWWPTWAGLAQSGDLGFTTGPAEADGQRFVHYFTVWKKQPDGAYRWVYDGGVSNDATLAPGPDVPPVALRSGAGIAGGGPAAFEEVKLAEADLAEASEADLKEAYRRVLSNDARVQGSPSAPATTPGDIEAELASRHRVIDFTLLGGEASAAGDLAWTYGSARWIGGQGYYVRIWQRRGASWALVFDQILNAPAPKS